MATPRPAILPVSTPRIMNRFVACSHVRSSDIQRTKDNAHVLKILQRLEKKVDVLTSIMSSPSVCHLDAADAGFTPEEPCTSVGEDNVLPSSQPICEEWSPDSDKVIELRYQSNSCTVFAVRLLKGMFQTSELVGRNVRGVRGKSQVDPARIEKIMELVFEFFPTSPAERHMVWRNIRKGIDSFLRKLK